MQQLFQRLKKSKFRSKFNLTLKDIEYIDKKGLNTISSHARDFVNNRLAPAVIPNDGKQTPMRGHPVFIAQHATATCCRGCLLKWHGISKDRGLTEKEKNYIVIVIIEWIKMQIEKRD